MTYILVSVLFGCLINDALYEERLANLRDGDADGWTAEDGDCDDADPATSPAAEETWIDDGIDNDCDGERFEVVTWEASAAATRVDGVEAGGELGRVLVAAPELGCLYASAPYADEARGAVYAIRDVGTGVRTVAEPLAYGAAPSTFLTAAAVTSQGELALTALSAEDGRGAVWITDAAAACAGTVALDAHTPIVGAAPDDLFGASVRALPDLDGDGVADLGVLAPGYDGASSDEGAMALFLQTDVTSFGDADLIVTGGYAGAALADVVFAASGGVDGWLLFARSNQSDAGVPLVRVPVDSLVSGSVDDLADGGLATSETWVQPTVVGDMDFDGTDEVVVGASAWRLWSAAAFEGVVEDGVAGSPLVAGEEGEWLTGFTAIGDVDGGGRPDVLLLADDWPAGESRGRLGLLTGENFLPGQSNALAAQRHLAVGDAPGDTFAYRAAAVGDLDGDEVSDVAVASYGADTAGSNAGSIYLLPLPTSR